MSAMDESGANRPVSSITYARAGLVGNPSDHFNGKVLSCTFTNFYAEARVQEAESLTLSSTTYPSVEGFLYKVKTEGYDANRTLMEATVATFFNYLQTTYPDIPPKLFSLTATTTIPPMVGLAGSSALILSIVKALACLHDITIPMRELVHLERRIENEELKNPTGWMDAVSQLHEGFSFKDFSDHVVDADGHGQYEILQPNESPQFYLAFTVREAQASGTAKKHLQERYQEGDPVLLAAKKRHQDLVDTARIALMNSDIKTLSRTMNETYELRKEVLSVLPHHNRMIEIARNVASGGNFTGSGGSIVGIYTDDDEYAALKEAFEKEGCTLIKLTLSK